MPSPDGLRLRSRALARRGRARGRRRSTRWTTWRRCSPGIDLGQVTVSMTINAPAAIMMAYYVVAAEENGVPRDRLGGTIQADILKEYIAQKEWCFPVDPAMRLLGDMIEWCATRDAALASGLDLGLPHPRGGLDGGAGARVHAQGRPHLRRAGGRPRARRRRLRAAAELLLQRAHRLLRGDREVPRGAADLGARAARHVRGAQPEVVADAHARADRRGVADRAAAAQQHHPHGDRGAGRRARRARSRCTPTRGTRRSRCRPRTRCGSRCAPSRSSPTRRG